MGFSVLIVDDEVEVCTSLAELLTSEGYEAKWTANPTEVELLLVENDFDAAIMDVRMPQVGGIDLLRSVKERRPDLAVIMISGYESVDVAVSAMRYGALNFYRKPVKTHRLFGELKQLADARNRSPVWPTASHVITKNARMRELLALMKKAAATDASVLLLGESGTGKELLADTVQKESSRREAPYVKMNCAAIPETLLESVLFGHEKGAFTDAQTSHVGKFEQVNGGTIFLDEIGEMSLALQAKLLRVLEEKAVTRIGGRDPIKLDFRLIAATNRELKELVRRGLFREDLYYRLAVIAVTIPPLRERPEDVFPLAEHFVAKFCDRYGKPIKPLSRQMHALLGSHNWPGNVRELQNLIERAVIFSDAEEIELDNMAEQYRTITEVTTSYDMGGRADQASKEAILDALKASNGVKTEAAKLLRINRKTLYYKMRRFGIQ